ncbi:MAG: FtsX-like permease family protein, partial [Bacteroidota bacterium]
MATGRNVAGRHLSPDIASDTAALVINQTMARELGLEQPLGARIMNWRTYTVVGVVEDFHFEDLQQEIVGLCFALGEYGSIIATKVQTEDMQGSVQTITSVWNDFMPNQPIRYSFLDEEFAQMYEQVSRTSKVFTVFSGLAILIACLGLFALSAYMVEQRRKEISIRKVVGASFQSLLGLLTVNYIWLIVVSLAISIPLGWYSMNRWLEGFTHHTELSWVPFVIAGGTTLLISLLTISFESIRVVRMDPAEALRSE